MKKTLEIIIYDGNDGQFEAGLGRWENMGDWKKEALLAQDPNAKEKVRSLDDFFSSFNVNITQVSTYDECLELIHIADYLVVCKGVVDADLLKKAENLKEIHVLGHYSTIIDNESLISKGVHITYYEFTNFIAVAEHALTLLLSLVKRLSEAQNQVKLGSGWMVIPGNVRLLSEMKIGILGLGEIGHILGKLISPFGSKIYYHDLKRNELFEQETNAEFVSWDELFILSDAISVHLPLNEKTEGIIGEKEFNLMKDNVILINTSRGPIIDENVMVESLKNGKIKGAGLDVFVEEPLSVDSKLQNINNVILTPHMAWAGPWTLVNDANRVFSGVAASLQRRSLD